MSIVLASESPFRRRALDLIGVKYDVCPSQIDEKSIRHEDATQLTLEVAKAKAHQIAPEHPDAVIVAGDAVAAKHNRIFEKPTSLAEAAEFLRELSDGEFHFITSLCVL